MIMENKKVIISEEKLRFLMKEDPDACHYNGKILKYDDNDAIPFIAPSNCDIVYIGYEGWTHYDLIQHLRNDDIYISKNYRNGDYWTGRFWKENKIFSFWKLPEPKKMKKIMDELSDFFEGEVDFSDYKIELSSNRFMYVSDYINNNAVHKVNFDIDKPHLLSPSDKRNSPQLKGALSTKYDLIGKKLGKNGNNSREVSQAEYNFYKRYGMGESIDESPDSTKFNGERLLYNDDNAVPFIFSDDASRYLIGDFSRTHGGILDDNDDEYSPDLERDKSYHGRFWAGSNVISFWRTPDPSKMKKIIGVLSSKFPDEKFLDYNLEIGNNEFTKVKDYISSKSEINNNFDLKTLHLLSPDKKSNTDQMKAALRDKYDYIGKKLGRNGTNSREVSQAEYNFYKRYGMGESISDKQMDIDSFENKKELNPKLWVNDKLKSSVRLRLLDIADDYLKECNLLWVKPKDIVITGSMAGYNWTKYSDIDVHIIIDYKEVFDSSDIVEDYFITKKNEWSNSHKDLTIYGHVVEIFVQDADEKLYDGVYSVENNKWINHPDKDDDLNINKDKIKKIVHKYAETIDDIEKKVKELKAGDTKLNRSFKKLSNIMKDLKKMRKDSINSKNNVGEIVYKILRRCGYLDKAYDLKIKSYDKAKTLY